MIKELEVLKEDVESYSGICQEIISDIDGTIIDGEIAYNFIKDNYPILQDDIQEEINSNKKFGLDSLKWFDGIMFLENLSLEKEFVEEHHLDPYQIIADMMNISETQQRKFWTSYFENVYYYVQGCSTTDDYEISILNRLSENNNYLIKEFYK